MKILYTFLFISLSFVIEAQPTITDAILPQIGTSSTYRLFNASAENAGPSGANVTWDFSSILPNETAIFDYKDPASMPASSTFPTANLGVDQNGNPQLYFLASSQELVQVGGQLGTLTEDYNSNPKELLSFPLTYGQVLTDTFEGIATLGAIMATRTGSTIIEADGHGTLQLPYTSFSNVLRVKSVSVYEDKISGNVVNTGSDTVYSWYMEGISDYLFTWSNITSDQFGSVIYGAYLDTMFVGLNEISSSLSNIHVYPNPVSDVLTIELMESSTKELFVELMDVAGRVQKNWVLNSSSGQFKENVLLGDIQKGNYFLKVSSKEGSTFKKLMIN